jgi:long-subunit acyl-CoA synthetase (AMP-forming)
VQGVLLTHRAVVATVAAQIKYLGLVGSTMGGGLGPDDVMLSYLPLAHIFDRCALTYSPTS